MSKAAPASASAPPPPANLAKRSPRIRTLQAGISLHRIFRTVHDPIHFDRSQDNRFNSPDGSFGVMYLAEGREGAFAETFLRIPGRTLIPLDHIQSRGYVRFELKRTLNLVLMSGSGLARLGATAEVCHSSPPYTIPQAWCGGLHRAFRKTDGIAYMARHDDQAMCVALFERASDALIEAERELDLDQDWFVELANTYGIGIAL